MSSDEADFLPADWRPHVDQVRDGIGLRVRGEHFPRVAFLCEHEGARNAIDVTVLAKQGKPFAEVDRMARAQFAEWKASRPTA